MANLLARGSITIAAVSDGYTLSLSAASVSIPANHDGSKPDLSHAYTSVTLTKGGINQSFNILNVIPSSDGIRYTYENAGDFCWKVAIVGLDSNISSGSLEIILQTTGGYQTSAVFSFSVVRNTIGIDWIEEWDGTHNQIGENYVITPKLFAGHKNADGKITGVYIGKLKGFIGEVFPFTLADAEEGIYGYRDNKIVFYIDNNGARIGGWDITPSAIQCEDGTLSIKSEGAISSQSNGITHWSLNKDGSSSFANGKVTMDAKGNAAFEGTIKANGGYIAGWTIESDRIYKDGMEINTYRRFIAIANVTSCYDTDSRLTLVRQHGGIGIYYSANIDYGIICYKSNLRVFAAGSNNYIAGWYFDNEALWIGTKNNNTNQYTSSSGHITIGTNGLRGFSWYINKDGSASFVKGYVTFGATSGKIACWSLDNNSLYCGTKKNISFSYTTSSGSITIGSTGIRGNKWRLESDGSGAVAGGNISWDKDGNTTFSTAVSLLWETGIDNAQNEAGQAILNAKVLNIAKFGQMLYRDPEFNNETPNTAPPFINGTGIYTIGETATREIKTDSNAPNGSKKIMYIKCTKWFSPDDNRIGGFYFANNSRANAEFMVRIVAKIPADWKIENYHNSYGTGGKTQWVTPQLGTGKYEEYICIVTCGSSGTFSTVNHFALVSTLPIVQTSDGSIQQKLDNGSIRKYNELIWTVAYCTVYDAQLAEKITTTITKDGIYTGTLTASQITAGTISSDRIASNSLDASKIISKSITATQIKAGSITATELNADSIKSNIINTSYINGLSCTFTKGTIGGWSIGTNSISKNSVSFGSDGSILNGSKWRLNSDGSGSLAGGNISWNTIGDITCHTGTFTDITVKGNSIFGGIVKSSLYYGNTLTVTSASNQEYIINPETSPYNCYVINRPTNRRWIELPQASKYDGLEIQIFTIKPSNWNINMMTFVRPCSGDSLYIKVNAYNYQTGTGSGNYATFENYNAEYKDYKGTSAYMIPDKICKFKSMNGAWYAVEGLFTGE